MRKLTRAAYANQRMTLSKKSAKFQIQKRSTMIALRGKSTWRVFISMFLYGRLPMPLGRRGDLKTRHSSFLHETGGVKQELCGEEGDGKVTGSDFKNSKWCKEGATERGRVKVSNGFKAWTSRVGNYGLLSKARQLYNFFLSPKVTGTQKTIVVGALLYLISPLDLIPDFIPVVGWLDDLGIAAFALNYIFATIGKIKASEADELSIPAEFKLTEQQVVDAIVIDEDKAAGFRIGNQTQVSNPSVEVKRRLDEVADIARALNVNGAEVVSGDLERMFSDTRLFQIAVVGRYSTGKSTFVNALLSKDILPSKPVPTTKAVTYLIKGGSCSVCAEFEDGSLRIESGMDESVISGVYDAMTEDKAKSVTISLPDFPFPDLTLIDTPGIEDPEESVAQRIVEIARQSDAVIVLLDANYPQNKAEYEFIRSLTDAGVDRKLFIVVNKCDGKDVEACNAIRAKCLDELRSRNVINEKIHVVSALLRDQGFLAFRELLSDYLCSSSRSEIAAHAKSELDRYARSLRSVCNSLIESAAVAIKDKGEQEAIVTKKRQQVSACFDNQANVLSKKIDGCKAQMRSDLTNFIGELKSNVRASINASDFNTLKNTDAIAVEVNRKLRAFIDGQMAALGELVSKGFEKSGQTVQSELESIEIPLPSQTRDPSAYANMFVPFVLTTSYLLFGVFSMAFIGSLVFAVLGRNYFESAIRRGLETFGLENARTKIGDEVSEQLDDCERKIWLQISAAVEGVREKVLSAVETRRSECLAKCSLTETSNHLSLDTVKECRARLAAVIGE